MIVECISFGSLWWLRPGADPHDSLKYTSHAAVFNTTGFCWGARERRNWTVPGVVRFNAGTLGEQRITPDLLTCGKFQAAGIERSGSWNRLLLTRKVRRQLAPDAMLVGLCSSSFGVICFGSDWRTEGVRVIASSSLGREQESLLLMAPGSEFTTTKGTWRCECNNSMMKCLPVRQY
jgi:hypothetical protein